MTRAGGTTQSGQQRLRLIVRGAVQGVGFRPFVYRLALGLGLRGWVNNTTQGVLIEVEGSRERLEAFQAAIIGDKPPQAIIQGVESTYLKLVGYRDFEIQRSDRSGARTTLILPDLATCADCLQEVRDPDDRRYRYPFTNCTNCGPRYSIIEALPYDRPHTTMKGFPMCKECRDEYENPLDRRFHAQPIACPRCGPRLALWDAAGAVLAGEHEALQGAAQALRAGQIVAVKGLSGFHLLVDARDEAAVARLRRRKAREAKPLAVMFPSLAAVREACEVPGPAEQLLTSAACPIVLLARRAAPAAIASAVAPANPYLGAMLPYTPLHHLLLAELSFPVVATSGNLSDEPICTDQQAALILLGGIADLFLVHDRPIARPVDDSVLHLVAGRELMLRRARGYAPLPVRLAEPLPPTLAVGGQLKNTVALALGENVFLSQHLGDLQARPALEVFRQTAAGLQDIYGTRAEQIACDLHPEYQSTAYAEVSGLPVTHVQHHYAHVLSCMAENGLSGTVLGVAWDGTGYGPDGTVWGGEFLLVNRDGYSRAGHLRVFPLPGGEQGVKEPRRAALGVLYEVFGDSLFELQEPRALPLLQTFSNDELRVIRVMLARGLNTPLTSSVGRLFDAAASLLGLGQRVSFEGQAAMALEWAIGNERTADRYPFVCAEHAAGPLVIDWRPLVRGLLDDRRHGVPLASIATRFHNTLVECLVEVARRRGEPQVVLSGGCFQNRYLTERAVQRLTAEGFRPYWHRWIPPNDGGLALGQVLAVSRQAEQRV